MIRIRYRNSNELSPGLHAEAEQHGRRTTVYLLSGLTAAQRRSALRRLRLTARMGHCPRLPAGQLAFALFVDQLRTGIGRTGAVLRLHPAGSTVPIMVLSGGAIAFLLFSTVSIHVLRPAPANQSDAGTSPVVSASAIALGGGPPGQGGRGGSRNPGGRPDPSGVHRGSDTGPLAPPAGGVSTTPVLAAGDGAAGGGAWSGGSGPDGLGPAVTGSSGGATDSSSNGSGGTTLSGGANRNPVRSQPSTPDTSAVPPATSPATTPAPSDSDAGSAGSGSGSAGSGSSAGSSNGMCVNVGPLGVCLNI